MDALFLPTPNPSIPQAYLPPDFVSGYEGQTYVFFLSLGAWLWDLVNAWPEEWKTVWWRKPSVATTAYMFSRAMTLAALVSAILMQVLPTSRCNLVKDFLCVTIAFATSGTAFLFFIRVRAVYSGSTPVSLALGVLWLAVLGMCLSAPFFISAGHIGPTKYCIITRARSIGSPSVAFGILTVYDTLVFVLMTWRISNVSYMSDASFWGRTLALFRGDGLPRFSRTVLRHGQKYYLATVLLNLLAFVMVLTPAVPVILHSVFIIPAIVMQNALACRVFRDTMLDIACVNEQRFDLGRQSSIQIRHDIDLSDALSKNGFGGSVGEHGSSAGSH